LFNIFYDTIVTKKMFSPDIRVYTYFSFSFLICLFNFC